MNASKTWKHFKFVRAEQESIPEPLTDRADYQRIMEKSKEHF